MIYPNRADFAHFVLSTMGIEAPQDDELATLYAGHPESAFDPDFTPPRMPHSPGRTRRAALVHANPHQETTS